MPQGLRRPWCMDLDASESASSEPIGSEAEDSEDDAVSVVVRRTTSEKWRSPSRTYLKVRIKVGRGGGLECTLRGRVRFGV